MTNVDITTKAPKKGFTLLELSIVLVIIGLIVGGVLVGQDLIKAAEVRATVGQYEKFNASINTFRTKFDGIPGDLAGSKANAFGLLVHGTAGSIGTTGFGDGNGLINDTASTNTNLPVGETLVFWRHLSDASLTDGAYGRDITTALALGATPTPGDYFPPAKLGRGNYWVVGSAQGDNYYVLGGVGNGGTISGTTYNATGALTPIETFNIDTKVDDGAPNTGQVQARGIGTSGVLNTAFSPLSAGSTVPASVNATSTAATCMVGAAGALATNTYNRNTATGGNDPSCVLRLRFN